MDASLNHYLIGMTILELENPFPANAKDHVISPTDLKIKLHISTMFCGSSAPSTTRSISSVKLS